MRTKLFLVADGLLFLGGSIRQSNVCCQYSPHIWRRSLASHPKNSARTFRKSNRRSASTTSIRRRTSRFFLHKNESWQEPSLDSLRSVSPRFRFKLPARLFGRSSN